MQKNASLVLFYIIWPFFDILLPPVTSNDLWGQNILVYNTQGYHMIIWGLAYAYVSKKCILNCIFEIWPLLDTLLPPVISNDLWGQNIIVYSTQGYQMSIFIIKCNHRYVFKFWVIGLFLTFLDFCVWPSINYLKIIWETN